VLWSPSYFAASCGGAPIAIVRQYSSDQIEAGERGIEPRSPGRYPSPP